MEQIKITAPFFYADKELRVKKKKDPHFSEGL
jgi:hypothetical protein